MKKLKQVHLFIIGVLFLSSFLSCVKDDIESRINNTKVEARTELEPGQISVQNGMLVFPTILDFKNTVLFLAEATETQKENWRNSFSIETAEKSYINFLADYESFADSIITMTDSLETIYLDKIRMVEDSVDGDTTYLPKFKAYNEFVNLDGLFKLDSSIIKVTENKIISFTEPSLISDFEVYDDNTILNDSLGVIPNEITTNRTLVCTCENPEKDKIFINYGTYGRRFKMEYVAQLLIAVVNNGNGGLLAIASLQINAEGVHQQKKFIGWWNQKINSTHTFRAEGRFESDDLGLDGTWEFPETTLILPNNSHNRLSKTVYLGSFDAPNGQPDNAICIDSANQTIERTGYTNYLGLLRCI